LRARGAPRRLVFPRNRRDRALDVAFRPRIERGRRLVQHDHGRLDECRTRECNELPLAGRQPQASMLEGINPPTEEETPSRLELSGSGSTLSTTRWRILLEELTPEVQAQVQRSEHLGHQPNRGHARPHVATAPEWREIDAA
jgi:hypothetical protein